MSLMLAGKLALFIVIFGTAAVLDRKRRRWARRRARARIAARRQNWPVTREGHSTQAAKAFSDLYARARLP